MADNQELLSRISLLAGHINLHKGRQQGHSSPPPHTQSFATSGSRPSYDPYYARSRGHAGKYSVRSGVFRNRSLVVKRIEKATAQEKSDTAESADHSDETAHDSWVSKRDRHLQLINAAHYDTMSKNHSQTIPQTSESAVENDGHTKVAIATDSNQEQKQKHNATDVRRLFIGDIAFQVSDGGSKLVREKEQASGTEATPESTVVGGVEFRRDHNGDMRRKDTRISRCFGPSCPLTQSLPGADVDRKPCKRFSNTGECSLGPRCAYTHDPSKVAICREFLRHGTCKDGSQCDLSHDCAYERVPACSHFQRGKCTKTDCRYAHVRVNPTAPVCRAFSVLGYCSLGSACSERHVFECPDYSSSGTCSNPNCRLPHRDRASQLRQHESRAKDLQAYESGPATYQKIVIDSDHSSVDDQETNHFQEDPMDHVVPSEGDFANGQVLDGENNFIWL